ncbi:MAG: radical SAM protein [Bacteroidetes bacterium]|nr:radical SAM protein [Bacteroidota bacterium]
MEKKEKRPDILLVPPITSPYFVDNRKDFLPVGLLTLVSCLRESSFTSDIYKPTILLQNENDYFSCAEDILKNGAGIIGFSTWCHSFPSVIVLAEKIKAINPSIPIVLGGPQASILHKETLERYPFIDYVIRNEADYNIILLLKNLLRKNGNFPELQDIKGLTYRNARGKVIANPSQQAVPDLNLLPIPAYEKIQFDEYLSIDVGRGCPFNCTFCSTNQFFSRLYRVKSVKRIIEEMDYCYDLFNATWFGLSHDMLTLNKNFVLELCKGLSEHNNKTGRKYTWNCSARTDCVSNELLTAMSESGCVGIFFGIESGSERIQKQIKKKLKLNQAHEIINNSCSVGIRTSVSYMAGFPDETKAELKKTIESVFITASMGAKPQMTLLSILPGTSLYSEYKDELKYDGLLSGFTGIGTKEFLEKFIKNDPEFYSSFFYFPVKELSRPLLTFTSNLVNLVHFFTPTLIVVKESTDRGIEEILELIDIDMLSKKEQNDLISRRYALKFLVNIITIVVVDNANKLPGYISDIMQLDMTKAFMAIKMTLLNQKRSLSDDFNDGSGDIDPANSIEILPVWKILSLNYSLLEKTINFKAFNNKKLKSNIGKNKYLVIGISENESYVSKLSDNLSFVLENLSNMRVSEYLQMCCKRYDEKTSREILGDFQEIGVIRIIVKTEVHA